MCGKFRENQIKAVGVAIWNKFDDTHPDRQTNRQTHISVTHTINSIRCKQQLSLMAPTYKNCRFNAWARYTYDMKHRAVSLRRQSFLCSPLRAATGFTIVMQCRSARHCTLYTALSIHCIRKKNKRSKYNLTKSASWGAHSPVRGHPRGSKVVTCTIEFLG